MSIAGRQRRTASWGKPPWALDLAVPATPLPAEVDLAIVGGGFTGLAVAVAVRQRAPGWRVAVLEASELGAGASARTGGIVLDETAIGALPGLGNVLDGFASALRHVLLFAAGNLLVWHALLVAWERVGYRGSLEWVLAKVRRTEDRAHALRSGA